MESRKTEHMITVKYIEESVMHKLITRISPLALLCITAATQPAQAADATVNRLLASQCAQCHGTNGHSSGGFESIAGEEIAGEMNEMQRETPSGIMDHQALGYTADQIDRIDDFYASGGGNSGGGNSGGGNSSSDDDGDSGSSREHKKSERNSKESERNSRSTSRESSSRRSSSRDSKHSD
jgi:sulfide dehydrogenase cytochrome subunit